MKLGHLQAARELFKKCTSVNSRNAASWQAWGTMERQAGNIDEAARLLSKGLRASPKNTWVMQALALLEWERGNQDKAESLFKQAIALKPWDGGLYQVLLFFCLGMACLCRVTCCHVFRRLRACPCLMDEHHITAALQHKTTKV